MNIVDKILDKTILFSFDKSGYLRHQKSYFEKINPEVFSGKKALITGGTSGIGLSCTHFLQSHNCECVITGRDAVKGNQVVNNFKNVTYINLDMANWNRVIDFAKNDEKYDYLVLNAGGMSDELLTNEYGIEYQTSAQLFGHYYLAKTLAMNNCLSTNAKIIWVTSGGMLLKKIDLLLFFKHDNYNKVKSYANIKRAQHILMDEMSKDKIFKDYVVSIMHPGWVETPGIKTAISGFYHLLKTRLRNPDQGADTINWLLSLEDSGINGKFYFDRKIQNPYPCFGTKEEPATRKNMMDLIKSFDNKLFTGKEAL